MDNKLKLKKTEKSVFWVVETTISYPGLLKYEGKRGFAALIYRFFFYKKSLNVGSIFYKKEWLNMGPIFWLSPNGENLEYSKICEKGPIFQEKS